LKKKFLNYSLGLIKKYNPQYNEIKIDEIRYGLEGFYLTITKMIIIVILSLILNIFTEMLLLLFMFNIFRTTAFGMHASKSWICLLASALSFVGLPFLIKIIIIPTEIKIILSILLIIIFYLYAPADTKKRPLVRKERRDKYKFITVINAIIISVLALIIDNHIITNSMIFGMIIEAILISPITYKIFNHSYNNYETYVFSNDGLNVSS